ncbi:MAG: L,D-transpeptidase family protein [Phycisphaerae bacterium]
MFARFRRLILLACCSSVVLGGGADAGAQRLLRPAQPAPLRPKNRALNGPARRESRAAGKRSPMHVARTRRAAAARSRAAGVDSALAHLSASRREVLAWQVALDRAGFSPGLIDAKAGPKTRAGLTAFQRAAGLPPTGAFDRETREALGLGDLPVVRRYVLTEDDLQLVGPCPEDWIAKSKARWLGFASLASVAANNGHCSLPLLTRLNPGTDLGAVRPGDVLIVPNVVSERAARKADRLEVDFDAKTVRALDDAGRTLALFHCSIARAGVSRPTGRCTVASIAMNPKYLFRPEQWPEVKTVHRRLVIPPGPRSPVGVCWIGLSLKGYGLHGTPRPDLIGKTGSHGCIRLTNWDVLRLARMIRVGTPVRFVDESEKPAHGAS